jgi:predicted ABC-type ATPase
LIFLSLPSADLAVERVAQRVRQGGHAVPEQDVRRRFSRRLGPPRDPADFRQEWGDV